MVLLDLLKEARNEKDVIAIFSNDTYTGKDIKDLFTKVKVTQFQFDYKLKNVLNNTADIYLGSSHPLADNVYYKVYVGPIAWKIVRDVKKCPRVEHNISFYWWLKNIEKISKRDFASFDIKKQHSYTTKYNKYIKEHSEV